MLFRSSLVALLVSGAGVAVAAEPAPVPVPAPTPAPEKTGEELFREARALHNKQPAEALALYEQAAAKGYHTAHKMIGSLQVRERNTPAAIAAYKKYVELVPDAKDLDIIKDIIVRLGGTL